MDVPLFEELSYGFALAEDVEGEFGVSASEAVADDEVDVLADAFGAECGTGEGGPWG